MRRCVGAGSAGLRCGWEMQKVGSSREGEGSGRAAGQPRGKHTLYMHTRNLLAAEVLHGCKQPCSWDETQPQPPSCSQPCSGTWGCCFPEPWETGSRGSSPAHTCSVVTALWRMGPHSPVPTWQARIKAQRHHTAAKPSLLGQSDFKQQHELILPSKASSGR